MTVTLWLVITAQLFMVSDDDLVVEWRVRYIETCNNNNISLKEITVKFIKNTLTLHCNMP